MMKKSLIFLLIAAFFASCSEYNRVLKSSDYELKYEYAKKYYEQKKYAKATYLFEEVVPMFKGTEKAEESLYLLAKCYFDYGDYETSGQYFSTYYNNYPRGEYAELARYYAGYGYYMISPDPRLEQSLTVKAIAELQMLMDYFPKSDKIEEAQNMLIEMQDKLTEKELLSATLYYNLGTYLGNNYESAVITATNAIREYPFSKWKEDLSMVILRSRYEEANHSVEERQQERYRDVVDEYYSYANEYPEGKYSKEAKKIFDTASKKIND